MFTLLTDTGLGSVLMLLAGVIGIPVAFWYDRKRATK